MSLANGNLKDSYSTSGLQANQNVQEMVRNMVPLSAMPVALDYGNITNPGLALFSNLSTETDLAYTVGVGVQISGNFSTCFSIPPGQQVGPVFLADNVPLWAKSYPVSTNSSTTFLMHLDDLSIISTYDHSIYDDESISSANVKFGTGSWAGRSGSPASIITVQYGMDLEPEEENFTIDFWAFMPWGTLSLTEPVPCFCFNDPSIETETESYVPYHFEIIIDTDGYPMIFASSTGKSWDMISGTDGPLNGKSSIALTPDAWNHIAIVRNGSNWRIYLNGEITLDITVPGSVFVSIKKDEAVLRFGMSYHFATYAPTGFYMDEFRFIKGLAEWTQPFTPPTAPYVVDSVPVNLFYVIYGK